jgi:hypothetical protein
LECKPALIVCNNLLNVIKEDQILAEIVQHIATFDVQAIFSVYEGNKSGIGSATKKDCYQRNETKKSYIPLLKRFFDTVYTKKGLIIATNAIKD